MQTHIYMCMIIAMMMGRLGWWCNHELTVHGAIFFLSFFCVFFFRRFHSASSAHLRARSFSFPFNQRIDTRRQLSSSTKQAFFSPWLYLRSTVLLCLFYSLNLTLTEESGTTFVTNVRRWWRERSEREREREICVDERRRKSREFGSSQQRLWSIETKEKIRSEKRREFNEWSENDLWLWVGEIQDTSRDTFFSRALLCCYYFFSLFHARFYLSLVEFHNLFDFTTVKVIRRRFWDETVRKKTRTECYWNGDKFSLMNLFFHVLQSHTRHIYIYFLVGNVNSFNAST